MAWIRDDYGDGAASEKFYGGKISEEQRRIAKSVRRKVESELGSYTRFKAAMMDNTSATSDPQLAKRAANATTRTLSLQWVEGNAEKAETSFFKINKQGTPLDKTEERLLRDRRKPIAIVARSIVRAGSGHKYWSSFEKNTQETIEKKSKELHELLFTPELALPIKTLNLPHGGKSSPIHAYNLVMDVVSYIETGTDKTVPQHNIYTDDTTGDGTIQSLKNIHGTLRRITGNDSPSLGLHPAVYFYSHTGKHWDMMFVSIINVFAKAVRNNDDDFFKRFTENRESLESILLSKKALIGQANIAIRSSARIARWSKFIEKTARGEIFKNSFDPEEFLNELELSGKLIASEISEASENFSNHTKSAIFLSSSIASAQKCPICRGLVIAEKSVSYDHITPKSEGGLGSFDNGQMTHPYCNSIKEHLSG